MNTYKTADLSGAEWISTGGACCTPMILLGKKNTTTLTLGIYRYVGQFTRYMSETMAAVVITLIPIVILYFAFSTQIMEGMTSGAVKG